jgi:MSHA biogenesis protein MshN
MRLSDEKTDESRRETSVPAAGRREFRGQVQHPQEVASKTATPAAISAAVESAGKSSRPSTADQPASSGTVQGAGGDIEKRPRIETPKERAEQEYRKAYSLLTRGRTNEAIPLLRAALAEDAGHVSARLALAGVFSQSGRHEDALALVSEGLELDPARPDLALAAARLLVGKGNFGRAAQTLSRASALAQGDPEYRAFHAAVLQRLTLHKDAVTEYQAALRLAPQAGVWWMGLGISLEADGRGAEAREAFQRARSSGALSAELDRFVEQKLRQLQ